MSQPIERRQFLSYAGTAILAASSYPLSSAAAAASEAGEEPAKTLPDPEKLPLLSEPTEVENEKMPNRLADKKRVGIAVVGLGRLALEEILPAFAHSKRAKVVALVSGNASKAHRVAEMYGISPDSIYNYSNFDSIRDNPKIHAVYIVLPNALHAEFTVRAAQAGKHVLCEKPMATSTAECERMIASCTNAKRKLMIAYRIQYTPNHQMMMHWVRSKTELGQVKLIELQNIQNQSTKNLSQWRLKKTLAGGGALPDIGLYCLNTARFLTGEEPTEIRASVYSTPGDPRFKEVEEEVSWTMRFPSGIGVSCLTSYGGHDSKRYRVLGNDGWGEMDPAFPYKGQKMSRGKAVPGPSGKKLNTLEQFNFEEKDQFATELDHFSDCIVADKRPYTPGEEGLQDQKIMEAIYESASTGQIIRLQNRSDLDQFRGTKPELD